MLPSNATKQPTPSADENGYIAGDSASASPAQTSKNSDAPSKPSTKHWRKPRDAKAFAAQANEVATLVLNGEIDLNIARLYSSVARTMAQVLSTEVYRARYLNQEPNLSLESEE